MAWHQQASGYVGQNMHLLSEVKGPTTCDRPLEHGQLPDRHFQRIHVDMVGPLPISQGKSHHVCLPSSTVTHGGQRPYRWLMPQPPHNITLHSLVCQQTSPLIGGRNLPQTGGQPWGNYWGLSYITQLPTTHRQMASLNNSTGSLKRHSRSVL